MSLQQTSKQASTYLPLQGLFLATVCLAKANCPNLGHLVENGKPLGSERAQDITLTIELFLIPCWLLRCPRRRLVLLTVYSFAPSDPN